ERERDSLLFARPEKDSLDPGQRPDRRRDRSSRISDIQLNDLVACAGAGILHIHADLDVGAGLYKLGAQPQIFILEIRIAQPEAEWIERIAFEIAIGAPPHTVIFERRQLID